jgi:hypothetical protein
MATRNTINRITSRIDDLAERYTPSGGPILIAVRDEADYRARLREIGAAWGLSGRRVIFIRTGVPRSAEFRQWSAVQDVAPGQVGEQESMPARQVGDPSAN